MGRKQTHAPDSEADTLTAAEPDGAAHLPFHPASPANPTDTCHKRRTQRPPKWNAPSPKRNPGVPGYSQGSSAGAAAGQRQAPAGGA